MKRHASVAVIATVLLLAGCSTTSDPASPGELEEAPYATFERKSSEGVPEATLVGTLQIAGGCLEVDTEAGHTYRLLVPQEATWEVDPMSLTPNGHTVKVGDDVAFGGGYYDPGQIGVDHICASGDEIFQVFTVEES